MKWLDFINGHLDLFFRRAREIQMNLKELGYYPGAIDGILLFFLQKPEPRRSHMCLIAGN